MKKLIKNIFCPMLLFIVIGCSSDNSPSGPSETDMAVGTYQLVELNVSPQQDVNEDGTASTNMLSEMSCLTGTLTLNADTSWNLSFTNLDVTEITGGMLFLACGDTTTGIGTWQLRNGTVTMVGGSETMTFSYNGTTLTNTSGENLPDGVQSWVYEKQ
ncbi:MAG: hypothetical protein ACR2MT_13130 [Aurantibacter sp.]